ncbi:phosphoesterase [Microbacterium phage Zooman]|nr:phosphoesterase [Microbacterium phage Zooman]
MPAPTLSALQYRGEQGNIAVADYTTMGVVDGDVLVWMGRSQGTISTDITPPTGWTRAGTSGSVGAGDRFTGIFYKYIPVAASEPLTYTFTGVSGGASSRVIGARGILKNADPAHLNDGGLMYRPDAFIPAITAGGTPYTIIAMWGAEFTAGLSPVPASVPSGHTTALVAQTAGSTSPAPVIDNTVTTGSRTGIAVTTMKVESGGSTSVSSLTTTYTGSPTSIKSASWVVRGLNSTPTVGLPVKLGNGTAAKLSFLDGTGTRKVPSTVSLWLPGFNDVASAEAKTGATFAHRGGSLNWPEFSQIAYDRSVRRGYGVLEFSCGWTSDLVPFGLGEQYIDAMAGVSGNVDANTMTWATLSSTYQNKFRPVASGVFQPLYRLEEFLDKYTPHHVCLVDPKFGWSSIPKITRMLDICDEHGGPDKIVIKFDSPVTGFDLVNMAKARGYKTMNYWGTEVAKLTTQYGTDKWDWIGVRYDADQTMYDTALAIGKPVWSAVIPDQTGYNTAVSRGGKLMMCSNVANITPVSVR